VLKFEIFVNHLVIFDIYVQKFRTLFVLTSICYNASLKEQQRGDAMEFLLRYEDTISLPEQFQVSQATLSHIRRRMLTTGSLNDNF
jgi:hypothetical protein